MTVVLPREMVFAFVEDGTLEVFPDQATATREYEGVDVESGTVRFYGVGGTYLKPVFVRSNKGGKLFGALSWVQSGEYHLVPDAVASEDSFALSLFETVALEPNPWFASMEELKTALAQEGVSVQYTPS